MIQQVPLQLLEMTINLALSLDNAMLEKLSHFENKTLRIYIEPFHWAFYMRFSSHGIHLLSNYAGEVNAQIYSTPIGLIRLGLLPASKARSLFHDGVRLEGDIEFAQEVKEVMDSLDIDWESHLARFTGDMVAYRLATCARSVKKRLKQARDNTSFQVSSYFKEEVSWFPSREVLQDFFDEVDKVAMDVERLSVKVEKGSK